MAKSKPGRPAPPPTRNGVGASCIVLPSGDWPSLMDFLLHRFPNVAAAEWMERLQRGDVLDEAGKTLGLCEAYRPHARLYYYRSLPAEAPIPFEEAVLFQDDFIVAADKPHFLPVTPAGRYLQETLLVRLKRKLGIDTLAPMHRIDRDTAGLVLFTIQPHTRDAYQSLFRRRAVRKSYEAIAPLRSDLQLPAVYRSRLIESASFMQMQETAGEANAETAIELLETKGGLARYRLSPASGQKHQLRVHMAALGIPIMNDRIYPVLQPAYAQEGCTDEDFGKPLMLLAKSLAFTDPLTGRERSFESLLRLPF